MGGARRLHRCRTRPAVPAPGRRPSGARAARASSRRTRARSRCGVCFVPSATAPTAGDWAGTSARPVTVVDGVERSVMQLSSRHDQPIDLVGWSLGGVYARELGRRHPERVRQVISLGSPFNMTDRRGSHSSDDYDRFAPLHDRDSSFVTGFVPSPEPLPIPSTAIYTRTDGIVAWQTCVQRTDARSENVEVQGQPLRPRPQRDGGGRRRRSSRPDRGEWPPFRPPHRLRRMYPDAVEGPGTAPNPPNEGGDRWIA